MLIHARTRSILSMDPWGPMGSHGVPWGPMGTHGVPWGPMGPPRVHKQPCGGSSLREGVLNYHLVVVPCGKVF